MKTTHIRISKYQLQILLQMLESNLRVCDPQMIKRSSEDQLKVDAYAFELRKLQVKLAAALQHFSD